MSAGHFCRKHPGRVAVDPIACRRCAECHQAALLAYETYDPDRERGYPEVNPYTETAPDGRFLTSIVRKQRAKS